MMIKDGGGEEFVTEIIVKDVLDLRSEEQLYILGLFVASNDGDKQRMILD